MQHDAAEEAALGQPGTDPGEPEVVDQDAEREEADGRSRDDGGSGGTGEPEGIGQLTAQLQEWKETAVRVAADLDNYRKRMAREKSELLRYANQSLLEELLPVLDNFEMGLQAAAQDEGSMIFQGMQMVKKQLDDFLANQGVEEVAAGGEVFDPNLHEAVSEEESAEAKAGTVLRVLRRGYRMQERLLRPANVVVAKAPEGAGGETR